jgi:proteasome lid subunit RPN8/RPN11
LIVITKKQYRELLEHSVLNSPNEACGLLGGIVDNGSKYVRKVYLLTNTDNSPEHFTMDPGEQFAAVKDMRNNGWVLLGNFHSHPASPSRPSQEDKRLAFDPSISYLIISLTDKQNIVLKSFNITGNGVSEEKLIIED